MQTFSVIHNCRKNLSTKKREQVDDILTLKYGPAAKNIAESYLIMFTDRCLGSVFLQRALTLWSVLLPNKPWSCWHILANFHFSA